MAHTNKSLGERIGLTHSTISRIRNGHRHPSIETMIRIEAEFGWTIGEQAKAREAGNYAEDFARRVLQPADESESEAVPAA